MISLNRAKAVMNLEARWEKWGCEALTAGDARSGAAGGVLGAGDVMVALTRSGALQRRRTGLYVRGEKWAAEVERAKARIAESRR